MIDISIYNNRVIWGVSFKAEDQNQKMQELNKFVHYYTRFKNHENSYKVGTTEQHQD